MGQYSQVPGSILLATMALDLGGAETHVVSLARELKQRGIDVIVASRGGVLERFLQDSDIHHINLALDSRAPWRLFTAEGIAAQVIIENGISICHAHGRIPAWVLDRAVKRVNRTGRRVPLVTTYHGLYNASLPFRLVTRIGDRMIAVSNEVKDYMIQSFDVDPNKIVVIPNGIDTERFRPVLDEDNAQAGYAPSIEDVLGKKSFLHMCGQDRVTEQMRGPQMPDNKASTKSPVILHISRLTGKFADTAIALAAAAGDLRHVYPDLLVVIVGDGDRYLEVKDQVSAVNARAQKNIVVFTGPRDDVERLMLCADLVVGVGRVALESMSCGKPVLIAGESGIAGLVLKTTWDKLAEHNFTARSGGCPLEPQSLASAIKDAIALINNPESKSEISSFVRNLIVKEFSLKTMTDRIERIYTECILGAQ
jgi:glycosyltransferase involved in cell wall biosynthesis